MDPKTAQARLKSAIELHTTGDLSGAEAAYQAIIKDDPHQPDALHLYGVLFLQQGKPDRARELIEQAIAISPDFADYHLNLAGAHFGLGDWAKAESAYERAAEINPTIHEAWKGIGACRMKTGDPKGAVGPLRKSLEIQPRQLDVVLELADALEAGGERAEAIRTLQLGLRLDDHSEEVHRRLANLFESGDDTQNAGMAWYNVAIILQKRQEIPAAIKALQRSLELHADNPKARYSLESLTGQTPDTAPAEYVVDLFNSYAGHFDEHLKSLEYEVPQKLHELITGLPDIPKTHEHLLDLGCGTGQCGVLFGKDCRASTGIDMAPKMIEVCRERGVYQRAECAELHSFLEADKTTYDLILATDLFIYVGRLEKAFALIASNASPGAVFGFSVETIPGDSFELRDSGRFAHADAYIGKLASENGFEILADQPTGIRIHKGSPIPGKLFVLWRSAANQGPI